MPPVIATAVSHFQNVTSHRLPFGPRALGIPTAPTSILSLHLFCACIYSLPTSILHSIAEVMGAVLSVLIIWVLTGVLVYQAIERIVNGEHKINADIMLVVASCGVGVNVL